MGAGNVKAPRNIHYCSEPDIEAASMNNYMVQTSRKIDQALEDDAILDKKTLKILLLGGAESGKSTIFRQMRILHMNGFSESDIINFRYLIHSNVIEAMRQLIKGAAQLMISLIGVVELVNAFELLLRQHNDYDLDKDMVHIVKNLWHSGTIQYIFTRRNEFTLLESAQYYFDNITRIGDEFYRPTNQDILRARVATTGIHEIEFTFKSVLLRMIDVGGQRSEQRKWIHCFDNVHAVLFIASTAAYDRMEDEDKNQNSMERSLKLLTSICSNKFFTRAAIIVFLNKIDVLSEKISDKYPLTLCFPEYRGGNEFEEVSHFIRDKFTIAAKDNKNLYTHFTVATDTENVAKIFESCMHVIMKQNIARLGFL